MPEGKYEDLVILEIRLDALRQQICNAFMLRHEEIEGIISRKLDEVLNSNALAKRIEVEVEGCVNRVLDNFFDSTGLGYSMLRDAVEEKLANVSLCSSSEI